MFLNVRISLVAQSVHGITSESTRTAFIQLFRSSYSANMKRLFPSPQHCAATCDLYGRWNPSSGPRFIVLLIQCTRHCEMLQLKVFHFCRVRNKHSRRRRLHISLLWQFWFDSWSTLPSISEWYLEIFLAGIENRIMSLPAVSSSPLEFNVFSFRYHAMAGCRSK